jgi:hypothetical protein
MKNIKKFIDFLNESSSAKNEFDLDPRFDWSDDIADLIDQILEKSEHIKDYYDYDRHGGKGFEFDIKVRTYPNIEDLSSKYDMKEDELYSMWDLFLSDNLQSEADDMVQSSGYFHDWYQEGRSGGWLSLTHSSDAIENPYDLIRDTVSDLNYFTDKVDDSEIEELKNKEKEGGAGFRFLNVTGVIEKPESINNAEEEAKEVKQKLEEIIKELDNLETDLENVEKRIKNFWDNSSKWFEEVVADDV